MAFITDLTGMMKILRKAERTMDIGRIMEKLPLCTFEHMYRVGSLAALLSRSFLQSLPCPQPEKSALICCGEAAFYHDIGKAFIPPRLITKPESYTSDERAVMSKHSACAEVIFSDIGGGRITGMPERLTEPAREAAVSHHEWWNGGGYPYGKSSEEIPLVARITSVCDAYDAMTSDRSYRSARRHSEACRELRACAGTQFDPGVVGAFLRCEGKISRLYLGRASLNREADVLYGDLGKNSCKENRRVN